MVPTVKMELLRSLIVQCLSAAAEEIFKIAEKTIAEYEEETSRGSRWMVDGRWRRLDVDRSHGEENLPMSNADVQQTLPVSVNLDQETLVAINMVKQEFDQDTSWSPEHPEDRSSPSSSYRCRLCEHCFTCKSEFIVRMHEGQDCDKNFEMKDSPFTRRQKDATEKPDTETQPKRTEFKEEQLDVKTSSSLHDSSKSSQALRLHQIQTDGDKDVSATLTEDHIQTEASANGDASEHSNSNRLNQILCTTRTGRTTKLPVQLEAGTEEKPFRCPCCVKCFSLRKTLMRHMKIHTEDKPYMCRFCGRNFCQKSALICHTRVHTGEKPYGCHVCGFSFAQKCNLLTHMRKHEAQKPFP